MRIVRRLLAALLVLVLVVAVVGVTAVGGLLAWVNGRAQPQASGTLRAPGLAAAVEVIRDETGIAHIYAETPDDLFFAQGFVHASERMWQMEVFRHIGAGRVSELFGESQLDTDRFIRTLGWRQAAEHDLAALDATTVRALERYAAGVNAWLEQSRGQRGLAFVVAGLQSGKGGGPGGYDPETWTPLDTVTFGKLQAWSLGGNYDAELFRLLADARMGDPALTDLLVPAYPAGAPTITTTKDLVSVAATATGARTGAAATPAAGGAAADDRLLAGFTRLAAIGDGIGALAGFDTGASALGHPGVGSNNWVVGPTKSATGTALLANDPHLGVQMPSIWYMNALHCRVVSNACPYDVAGVSFPSAPGVILGHNARIAWGATNTGPDVQDLFVETPDPANPANYLYKGASVPFTTRQETIAVAGGDPVTITVRETVHGPILNDVVGDLADAQALYSFRWTALVEADGQIGALLKVNVATSFAEFRDAFRDYVAPAQNFVYADIDGNIGLQIPGRIPVRPAGDDGRRPVDGSSGDHDWTGYVPYVELPALYNPPDGLIVTANNKPVDADYAYHLGDEWDSGWRATRIRQLLDAAAADGGVTQDDLSAIQNDARLLRADDLVPALLAAEPTTADGREVQRLIDGWSGTCDLDSLGCSAYEVTEWRLLRALFDPWLGTLAPMYLGSDPSRLALRAAVADAASPFWDDTGTPAVEERDGRLAAALDDAGAELRGAIGDPSRWAWARVHTTTFREQTLGRSGIGLLEGLFNAGPYGIPGTSDAVNNSNTSLGAWYPDPDDPGAVPGTLFDAFTMTNHPSYRLTIEMTRERLDAARIVISTGQGGNPGGRHYSDLIDDWIGGGTVPLPFTRDAVEAATSTRLVLEP
ncbi:MAG TPA: penicillin acylase family protein [Candidatus Nanopelagicales bacterium]|nr:penicillin acylase family protein [Candidatus Nanopelagicales bacterium]